MQLKAAWKAKAC